MKPDNVSFMRPSHSGGKRSRGLNRLRGAAYFGLPNAIASRFSPATAAHPRRIRMFFPRHMIS